MSPQAPRDGDGGRVRAARGTSGHEPTKCGVRKERGGCGKAVGVGRKLSDQGDVYIGKGKQPSTGELPLSGEPFGNYQCKVEMWTNCIFLLLPQKGP